LGASNIHVKPTLRDIVSWVLEHYVLFVTVLRPNGGAIDSKLLYFCLRK